MDQGILYRLPPLSWLLLRPLWLVRLRTESRLRGLSTWDKVLSGEYERSNPPSRLSSLPRFVPPPQPRHDFSTLPVPSFPHADNTNPSNDGDVIMGLPDVTLDPVFGSEDVDFDHGQFLPFMRQKYTETALESLSLRALILWDLMETTFRHELSELDEVILSSMALWNEAAAFDRQSIWWRIWEEDGFCPGLNYFSPLQNDIHNDRMPSIVAFYELVSTWPRFPAGLKNLTARDVAASPLIESALWKFYIQTHVDYIGRCPVLPTIRPCTV